MTNHSSASPTSWDNCFAVVEVSDGNFFCGELFQRKFGHPVPDWGRHLVAFYTAGEREFSPLSYLHFWARDRAGYIGGGCTDGNVVRGMLPEHRSAFNESGGALFHTLSYAFTHFDSEVDAFFGLAENPRAREVDLAAGFVATGVGNLLIKEATALEPEYRAQLMQQAVEVGVF